MILNGQIPTTALVKIDATHYASPGCARAWRNFSAAMVTPVNPSGLTVGNAADAAYRSLAWQRYRYHLHQTNPNLYPVAADPGTSNHGWGQAIDIGNYYRFPHKTLVTVGRRYGFEFDTPSEAWHIRYTGPANYTSAIPKPPVVLIEEEDEMKPHVAHRTERGDEWSLAHPDFPGGFIVTTSPAEGLAWERLYARGAGSADQLRRDDYIAWQLAAARVAKSMTA